MSPPYLEPPEWYASLPTVYVSACVLFTDDQDRMLLVKPNYRTYWAIPGGIVEDGEAPHLCAAREVAEELGLSVELGELLVVDWGPAAGRPAPPDDELHLRRRNHRRPCPHPSADRRA